jgi:hypothetical protein
VGHNGKQGDQELSSGFWEVTQKRWRIVSGQPHQSRRWGEALDRYCETRPIDFWRQNLFGYRDSLCLRYDKLDNFDGRSKEDVGSVTFEDLSLQKRWAEQMRITQKIVLVRRWVFVMWIEWWVFALYKLEKGAEQGQGIFKGNENWNSRILKIEKVVQLLLWERARPP